MTKKQIEKLAIMVLLAHTEENADIRKKKKQEINDFFRLLFDLYIVDDYKKLEKIKKDVYTRAADLYAEQKTA